MRATTTGQIRIVEAGEEHVPFIAWVELAAARSHLERGVWDLYLDGTEDEAVRFLEALASTEARHFAHYTNFLVAEVDGRPGAALTAYFEDELGMPKLIEGIAEANALLGRSEEDNAAGWRRAGSIMLCNVEHVHRAWIVEWVATAPEFRRRGLVDRLMAEILRRGRERGARTADIGVLTGNDPAQRAYEKNGFEVVDEKTHPDFEAAYHCPGVRLLRRSI
ncbi:MAG: GNAT family N-acetyltransferase [Dehalococcoidia bacterium]|nr:GNAT family N-acetyltransferase [Dehalococcoidia bacterium]